MPDGKLNEDLYFSFLLAELVGQIGLSWISDAFGRKKAFLASTALQIPLLAINAAASSLFPLYVAHVALGLCHVGIYFGAFLAICEYSPPRWRSAAMTYLLTIEVAIIIAAALYFRSYRRASVTWYESFGIVLNVIAAGAIFVLLPESPDYLYGWYRYEDSRKAFGVIARWNGKRGLGAGVFDTENEQERLAVSVRSGSHESVESALSKQRIFTQKMETQRSFLKAVSLALKKKRLRTNLIIMAWLWASAWMTTDVISYYPVMQTVSDDIYYQAAFDGAVDLCGYLIAGLVFGQIIYRKKLIFFVSYLLGIIGTVGLLTTHKIERLKGVNLASKIVASLGIASAFQGIFIVMNIFPDHLQSSTYGICNVFAVVCQIFMLKGSIASASQTVRLWFALCVMTISMAISIFLIGSRYIKA